MSNSQSSFSQISESKLNGHAQGGTGPVTPAEQALRTIEYFHPGADDVVELRALGVLRGRRRVKASAGYFVVAAKKEILAAVRELDGIARGIYFVLNRVDPELLARAKKNQMHDWPDFPLTEDNDIIERRWLYLDFDPERKTGLSSTDAEHEDALELAAHVRKHLWERGWPDPVYADSGNGAHLLYRLPEGLEPVEADDLVERALHAVDQRFSNERVNVDTGIFDRARLCKLYGTLTCKGDSTAERPHRPSRVIDWPTTTVAVTLECLKALADEAGDPRSATRRNSTATATPKLGTEDMEAWLSRVGLKAQGPTPYKGGSRWILEACPFNPEHTGTSVAVFELADGQKGFRCFHDSCADKHWRELQRHVDPSSLPDIQVNARELRDISSDVMAAVRAGNDPARLFIRAEGQDRLLMVRVNLARDGRPMMVTVTERHLVGEMTRCANFLKISRDKNCTSVHPPLDVAQDLLTRPAAELHLPTLEAIAEAPFMRPDGTVVSEPGYDPATATYYSPAGPLDGFEVPDDPREGDVKAARELLLEIFCDFPFVDDTSRANALAYLLTPMLRPAIRGSVPLALCDAPQAGNGKTLIADVVALVTTGVDAVTKPAPGREDEEWRKSLTATILEGRQFTVFDNVEGRLDSPHLAQALTTQIWSDRILGRTANVTMPQRVIFAATGNNITLGGDMPRRCYWIRLDAEMAEPWMGRTFRHDDLKGWVTENRGRLLAAGLTLARAWFRAGCPKATTPVLGSFEEWCRVIGGVLEFAGVQGFLGNLDQLYKQTDPTQTNWEALFISLKDAAPKFTTEKFTTAQLIEHLKDQSMLGCLSIPEELGDPEDRSFNLRLGRALGKRVDRRYGKRALYIRRLKAEHGLVAWSLCEGKTEAGSQSPAAIPQDHGRDAIYKDQLAVLEEIYKKRRQGLTAIRDRLLQRDALEDLNSECNIDKRCAYDLCYDLSLPIFRPALSI